MEWQVFNTVVAIISFFILIAKPMIQLNTSIVKLTDAVKNLQVFQDMNKADIASHQEKLEDHEHRITVLEEHIP